MCVDRRRPARTILLICVGVVLLILAACAERQEADAGAREPEHVDEATAVAEGTGEESEPTEEEILTPVLEPEPAVSPEPTETQMPEPEPSPTPETTIPNLDETGDLVFMVVESFDETVIVAVDSGSLRPVRRGSPLPFQDIAAMVYAADSLWLTSVWSDNVVRVDPESLEVTAEIDMGQGMSQGSIAGDDHSIWVRTHTEGLKRIDPGTNQRETILDAGSFAHSFHLGLDSLWILIHPGEVLRADPVTGEVLESIPIEPEGIADPFNFEPDSIEVITLDGSVWVSLRFVGDLLRINPSTGEIEQRIDVIDEMPMPSINERRGRVYEFVTSRGELWVYIADQWPGVGRDWEGLFEIDLENNNVGRDVNVTHFWYPTMRFALAADHLWVYSTFSAQETGVVDVETGEVTPIDLTEMGDPTNLRVTSVVGQP